MNDLAFPLPPFTALAKALRRITETLACELAGPTRAAPAWTAVEWRIAEAVAVLQGTSALLASRLQWQGPDRWQAFLARQARHTRLRRERIAELLDRMDASLRAAGIPAVALKGAALYGLDLYERADRPMGDIDLLVAPGDLDAVECTLHSLGFKTGATSWRHLSLEPTQTSGVLGFGEHIDNPIKVEVHTRIAERLPVAHVDITALEFPRTPTAGLNRYPSLAALMRHLLLHAAGNLRARALRNVQLHDIALLGTLMSEADWADLLNGGVDHRGLWWAFAPLALTDRYYRAVVPPTALAALAAGCPRWLRRACARQRLTDLSWSRLSIQAFPGIEWSSSVAEATTFMRMRIWPSRATLQELETGNRSLGYASANAWYRQPHAVRILRWLFSRPPRVQTVYSVQRALAHDPDVS